MVSSEKPSFEGLYDSLKELGNKDLQMTILFCHLLLMARKKKTTSYRTPAQAMGMFSAGLGGHLEELFQLNHKKGDPLYGSLVVNKSEQVPSEGFFNAAVRHGLHAEFSNNDERKSFWESEVNRSFAATVSSEIKDLFDGLSLVQRKELEVLIGSKISAGPVAKQV